MLTLFREIFCNKTRNRANNLLAKLSDLNGAMTPHANASTQFIYWRQPFDNLTSSMSKFVTFRQMSISSATEYFIGIRGMG